MKLLCPEITAKSETLLKESSLAIVDASGNNANDMWELGVMMSLKKNLIVILDEEQYKSMPPNLNNFRQLIYSTSNDNESFIRQLNEELSELNQYPDLRDENEPNRLLRKNEYNAAVISAFRLLESSLRNYNSLFCERYYKIYSPYTFAITALPKRERFSSRFSQ